MPENKIAVTVRCRPDPATSPLVVCTNTTITVRESNKFKFDHIFPNSTNEEVYEGTVGPKLNDLFKGINVTVIAYGATGSGKTYTMGTEYDFSKGDTEAGIIHRSVQDIFKKVNEDPASYSVKISFIEVYGEEVFDLLQPSTDPLPDVRQDSEGFKVPNVLELAVNSTTQMMKALKKGCSLRHTSATAKNLKSSRSHAIFTVYLEQKDDSAVIRRTKFLLVDLAGSERIKISLTKDNQMKEGIGINRGLMTLRLVIQALAACKTHIPFRDSKLTKILQDSLEASQVIVIACVFPTSENVEETINTLRYASLANSIIIKTKPSAITEAGQIASLKKKLAELQAALKAKSGGNPDYSTSDVATETNPSESGDPYYFKYIKAQHKIAQLEIQIEEDIQLHKDVCERFSFLEAIGEYCSCLKSNMQEVHDALNLALKAGQRDLECSHSSKNVDAQNKDISFQNKDEAAAEKSLKNVDVTPHADQSSNNMVPTEDDKETSFNDSEDCAVLNEQLHEIAEMMSSNADAVKELENLEKGVEAVDQAIVTSLIKQIEKLTEEKDQLQKIVNTPVDGKVKEQEKIDSLIEEINILKADLKAKKTILKQKEANKTEINRLKKENDSLKQIKVSLLKKIKEAGTKFLNLNFEKKKEITKLMKDTRRMQVEKNRIVMKLEKEINVLQRKLSTVSRKTAPPVPVRQPASRKLPASKESIDARVKDSLEDILSKKLTEMLNKKTEEEVKSVLPNLEQYESDAEINLTSEEQQRFKEKIEAAKFYVNTVMAKTSGGIKDQNSNIDDTIRNLLNTLTSLTEAKQGISMLIKEFLCIYEKMSVENDEKCCKILCDKTDSEVKFNTELNSLNDQIHKVTQEKREVIEINKSLVEQVKDLSIQLETVKTLEGEPQMVEKLNMQESLITELRAVVETYKKKDTEIQSLSKDLFRAKKGKSTPWLGPVPLPVSHKEEDLQTLMEEFLDESLEESFADNEDDPDWRGTPMYKRNKGKLVRKMPASEDDDSPPTKKSSVVSCLCTAGCKTMRCRCRKSKLDCSIECACKTKCFNYPNTSKD